MSTSEWLLLAARERERQGLSEHIRAAIERATSLVAAVLEEGKGQTLESTSPIVDYALGVILAAAMGREDARSAGEALGKITRLALEMRVLMSADARAPGPRLIGEIAAGSGQAAPFALSLACLMKPTPERLPLATLCGSSAFASRAAEARASWANEVVSGVSGDEREAIEAVLSALDTRLSRAAAGMRLFGLSKTRPPTTEGLSRLIDLSREALLSDPENREAWEVQRWGGFFGATKRARLFPAGLCVLALAEAGEDAAPRASELLAARRVDGFRYYDDYIGIPPDADDFGLALQLVALLPDRRALLDSLAWPIELFSRNAGEDGAIPVWFERHLREPVPEGSPRWLGSRCIAAAANALIGVAKASAPLPEGFFDRALAWISRTWEAEGAKSAYFYGAPYTRLLLARLAVAAEQTPGDPAPRARLRGIVDAIEAEIVATRRADGGFGGVLATACHLGVLALGRRGPFDPWPSVTFLAARQEGDGLFPREPFYLGPGKDGATVAHGARSLTAAVCLSTLVATRARAAT